MGIMENEMETTTMGYIGYIGVLSCSGLGPKVSSDLI